MRRRQAYAIKFPMSHKSDIVRLDTPQDKKMPEDDKKKLVSKKRGRPRKQEV